MLTVANNLFLRRRAILFINRTSISCWSALSFIQEYRYYCQSKSDEDPACEALRNLDPGHGIDTTDGRSYSQAVADGLGDTARRLNDLVNRGHLS